MYDDFASVVSRQRVEQYQKLWMNPLLGNLFVPRPFPFAEKPKAAAEPPKFKVGDCVKYRMGAGGGFGYIARAATDDERGDWLCKWTHATEETYKERELEHYLVAGDKVELLPTKDIWPDHSLVEMEGQTVTLEAWRSGATVVVAHDTLPAVSFGMTAEGNAGCWPLSRVKKL